MNRLPLFILMLSAAVLLGSEVGKATVATSRFAAPLQVEWHLEQLTSKLEAPETYRRLTAKEAGVTVTCKQEKLPRNAVEFRFEMVNTSKEPVFLRPVAKVTVPMRRFYFWNGYWDASQTKYDPTDNILSTLFPAIGAYDGKDSVIIGVRPTDFYSRLDPNFENTKEGKKLCMGYPVYLAPAENFTYSFVVTAAPGRYGYRDIVQEWYKIFEKEYLPADQLHPGVTSNESGYLLWNREYKTMPKYTAEMLRRSSGGAATWEWIYAPCIRGGDWDINEEFCVGFKHINSKNAFTKESVQQWIERMKKRLAPAPDFNIAPMWYVNVTWMEKSLCLERWPDLRFRNCVDTRSWNNWTIFGVYCFGSDYTEIFKKALDNIPKKYPEVRGIAWDSCFGHHIVYPENRGFTATPAKSFYNREPMALSAIGITHLLDYSHKNFNGGYRMANTVNYKELTPFYVATRTDCAEIEGTPMDRFDNQRVLRLEAARARLGTKKPMIWHKNLGPKWTPWIPYADLDEEEALEAYRQVTEDTAFLSYYWGAISRQNQVSEGVEMLWNHLPENISLIKQGWQPAPNVDVPKEILAARYGEGAGARIVLINANFEDKEFKAFFPKEYWEGKNLLLAAERPMTPLASTLDKNGTTLEVKLPARSIVIVRVGALIDTPAPITVKGGKTENPGRPMEYHFSVRTDGKVKFDAAFFRPEEGMPARVRMGLSRKNFAADQPINMTVDTGDFTIDWQTERHYDGDLVLTGTAPYETHTLSVDAIKALKLLELAKAGTLRVSADTTRHALYANRVCDFFNFLMQYEKPVPATVKLVAPGADADIVLITDQSKVKAPLKGVSYIENGKLYICAGSDAEMQETVYAVLRRFDRAFPWYGTIADDTYEGFRQIGLSGKKLPEKRPKPKTIYRPTMMEIFLKSGL